MSAVIWFSHKINTATVIVMARIAWTIGCGILDGYNRLVQSADFCIFATGGDVIIDEFEIVFVHIHAVPVQKFFY